MNKQAKKMNEWTNKNNDYISQVSVDEHCCFDWRYKNEQTLKLNINF